jgi:hypothetical protein
MNQNAKAIITLIFLLLVALGLTPFLSSSVSSLTAKEDAFVLNTTPTSNYGTQSLLVSGGAELRKTWIKFDLSSIPTGSTIKAVKLKLYCKSVSSDGNIVNIQIRDGLRTVMGEWSESDLWWSTQPPEWGTMGIYSITPTGKPAWTEFYSESSTYMSYVQTYFNNYKVISFALSYYSPSPIYRTTYSLTFSSREEANKPTLEVTYEAPPPPSRPTVKYIVGYTFQDQCGNLIPVSVTGDETFTVGREGKTSRTYTEPKTLTLTINVYVGVQTFSKTESVTIDKNMTKTITITRRFMWHFYVNYTDGTLANGKIIAQSTKETLTITVTNGYGNGYLLDGRYSISFESSPAVVLKAFDVTNDGSYYATLTYTTTAEGQKVTTGTETTSQEEIPTGTPESPVTSVEVPWLLIPSMYIYALIGVLAFGFILATIARWRRPLK